MLTGIEVGDPATEDGAELGVVDFNKLSGGIELYPTEASADANINITLNGTTVVDPAAVTIAEGDVVVIEATSDDLSTTKNYKVTVLQASATLTIETKPTGQATKFHVEALNSRDSWINLTIYEKGEYDEWAQDFSNPEPASIASFDKNPLGSNPYNETFSHVFNDPGDYMANIKGLGPPSPNENWFSDTPVFTIAAATVVAPKTPVPKPVGPSSIDQKSASSYEPNANGASTFFYNRILARQPDP